MRTAITILSTSGVIQDRGPHRFHLTADPEPGFSLTVQDGADFLCAGLGERPEDAAPLEHGLFEPRAVDLDLHEPKQMRAESYRQRSHLLKPRGPVTGSGSAGTTAS